MACAFDCKLKVLNEISRIHSSLNAIVLLLNRDNNLDLTDREFMRFFTNRGLVPAGFIANTMLFDETERITLFIDNVISNLEDEAEENH